MPAITDFIKKILGFSNHSTIDDTIEQLRAKINELETKLLKKDNSVDENVINYDKYLNDLLLLTTLVHDYTYSLLSSDITNQNINADIDPDKVIQLIRQRLQYRIYENPVEVFVSKLFHDFDEVIKTKDFNQLLKDYIQDVRANKFITEIEKKLIELSNLSELDYSQYKVLEELYQSFPLARRIIDIYKESIFQTNLFDNDYLSISKKEDVQLSDNKYVINNYDYISDKLIDILQTLRKYFNEKEIFKHKITTDTLKFGTVFVEIINKKEFLRKYNPNLVYMYPLIKQVKEKIIQEDIEVIESADRQLFQHYKSHKNNSITLKKHLSEKLVENTIDLLLTQLIDVELITEDTLITDNDSQILTEQQNNDTTIVLDKLISAFNTSKLNDIKIIIHKPYNVIPLHDNFRIYAYLVIDKSYLSDKLHRDEILSKLAQVLSTVNIKQLQFKEKGEELLNKFVELILNNVNKQLRTLLELYRQKYISLDTKSNSADTNFQDVEFFDALINNIMNNQNSSEYNKLLFSVYKYLEEFLVNKTITKLKVRIVVPKYMVRFYTRGTNYPYGESVISNISLHSILYLVSVYSHIINKISRSAIYRLWRVNVGALKAKTSLVNRIISMITSKPVNIDTLGNIKNISKIITAYKDVIQITDEHGNPAVDVQVQQLGQPQIRIEDIQEFKQDIAILSGIPSQRLGLQDNYELREKLVQTSIQFAEMISEIQDNLINQLLEFYDKILKISHPESFGKLNFNIFTSLLNISLHKPVNLKLLYYESIFTSISNIVNIFAQLSNAGINIDYKHLFKKLAPNIVDWDEIFEESSVDENTEISNTIKSQNNQNNQNQQQVGSNNQSIF